MIEAGLERAQTTWNISNGTEIRSEKWKECVIRVSYVAPPLSKCWFNGAAEWQMHADGCFHRMFTLIAEMWIREEASQCTGDQAGIEPSFRFCPRINFGSSACRLTGSDKRRERGGEEESSGVDSETAGWEIGWESEAEKREAREETSIGICSSSSCSSSNSSRDRRVEPWKQLSVLNAPSCALTGFYRSTSNHLLSHRHTHPLGYKPKTTILTPKPIPLT